MSVFLLYSRSRFSPKITHGPPLAVVNAYIEIKRIDKGMLQTSALFRVEMI